MRLCGISSHFWLLSPCTGQVTHALLTRPPLSHKTRRSSASFDLHVLSTPPAFILSQDQTLKINGACPLTRPYRLMPRSRLPSGILFLFTVYLNDTSGSFLNSMVTKRFPCLNSVLGSFEDITLSGPE